MEVPPRYDVCAFADAACDVFLRHGALLLGVKCDALRVPPRARERYRRVAPAPPGCDAGAGSGNQAIAAAAAAAAARRHTDAAAAAADEQDAIPLVLLNPGMHFVLRGGDHALVLATDIKDVDGIRVAQGPLYRSGREEAAASSMTRMPAPLLAPVSRHPRVEGTAAAAAAAVAGAAAAAAAAREPGPQDKLPEPAAGRGTADADDAGMSTSPQQTSGRTPRGAAEARRGRSSSGGGGDGGARRIRDAGARTGHIVILSGASLHRLGEILRGVRSAARRTWRDVVIVARDAVPPPCVYEYPFVYWLTGDPLAHGALRRAGVRTAHLVVVLMDRADCIIDIQVRCTHTTLR
jgi:hypothetical protein